VKTRDSGRSRNSLLSTFSWMMKLNLVQEHMAQ